MAADAGGGSHRSRTYPPAFEGYAFAARATRAGSDAEFFAPFSVMLSPDQGFDVGREILRSPAVFDHDQPEGAVDGLYWGAISKQRARTLLLE